MLDQKLIINFINKNIPGVIGIYLFGSYADNSFNKSSDVDIAILSTSKLDTKKLWDNAQRLAATLNKDVDLVDLARAETIFQNQIVTAGKRIWSNNEFECDRYENFITSEYLNFNEIRSKIVKDYKTRE